MNSIVYIIFVYLLFELHSDISSPETDEFQIRRCITSRSV
jgi:hypothetical protein